jgi:signal transduction histidine kinase
MVPLNKLVTSVFTRLLAVIIVAGIVAGISVGGFFRLYRTKLGTQYHRNIAQYFAYLIRDIGTPPSLARARQVAGQVDIVIHYEGQSGRWSTKRAFPDRLPRHMRTWPENRRIRAGFSHGRHLVEFSTDDGRYLFELEWNHRRAPMLKWLHLLLLLSLAIILLCAYLAMRRIFKPLRWLNNGVKEISAGNFAYRLPVKRKDELGDLAAAFNQMSKRIEGMLKSKEQLMLDVSHELRSPLTRIKVALEFLPDSVAKTNITTDIAEMEVMVSALLDTAKRHHIHSQLNWQSVSIATLLEQVVSEFAGQGPGVRLETCLPAAPLQVDPDRIKTVLRNIIDNAVKYSLARSGPVVVALESTTNHVVISITDDGMGMAPGELAHIFEPFYRIDKSRAKTTAGFGLGLSLCKTIIEAHKGKIEVGSEIGRGTTIRIVLPRALADRGTADEGDAV